MNADSGPSEKENTISCSHSLYIRTVHVGSSVYSFKSSIAYICVIKHVKKQIIVFQQ